MIERIEQIRSEQYAMTLPRHRERAIDSQIDILHTITIKCVASENAATKVSDIRSAKCTRGDLLTQISKAPTEDRLIYQHRSKFTKAIEVQIAKSAAIGDGEWSS